MTTTELSVRVPFAPLEEYVARVYPDPDGTRDNQARLHGAIIAAPWVATLLGVDKRQIPRFRSDGLSYFDADRYATALGVHPCKIWPDWWQLDEPIPLWRQLRAEALEEARQLRAGTAA